MPTSSFSRTLSLALTLVLIATALSSAEIPADFALVARFYPGAGGDGSGPQPWRLMISSDGTATQETSVIGTETPPNLRKSVRKLTVSRTGLTRLRRAIERADFFTLPRDLSKSEYEHIAGVVIKVSMGGRKGEVEFIIPNDTYNAAALTRFWSVWRALLREVPSPNENEELLHWIKYVRPDLAAIRGRLRGRQKGRG